MKCYKGCTYIDNITMKNFIKSMKLQKEYDLFVKAMQEEFIKDCQIAWRKKRGM